MVQKQGGSRIQGKGNLELGGLIDDCAVRLGVQLRIALGRRQQLPQVQHQVAVPVRTGQGHHA